MLSSISNAGTSRYETTNQLYVSHIYSNVLVPGGIFVLDKSALSGISAALSAFWDAPMTSSHFLSVGTSIPTSFPTKSMKLTPKGLVYVDNYGRIVHLRVG